MQDIANKLFDLLEKGFEEDPEAISDLVAQASAASTNGTVFHPPLWLFSGMIGQEIEKAIESSAPNGDVLSFALDTAEKLI